MKENCLNCGHNAHNGPLMRTEKDENGRKYQIEICKHYMNNVIDGLKSIQLPKF